MHTVIVFSFLLFAGLSGEVVAECSADLTLWVYGWDMESLPKDVQDGVRAGKDAKGLQPSAKYGQRLQDEGTAGVRSRTSKPFAVTLAMWNGKGWTPVEGQSGLDVKDGNLHWTFCRSDAGERLLGVQVSGQQFVWPGPEGPSGGHWIIVPAETWAGEIKNHVVSVFLE